MEFKVEQEKIEYYKDPDHRSELFVTYDIDDKAEYYSQFLHDGDFEYWMPCCFSSDSKKKAEADALKLEGTDKEKARILWIKNRFTVYQSPEWKQLADEYSQLIHKFME